jgi:hypothetical protein
MTASCQCTVLVDFMRDDTVGLDGKLSLSMKVKLTLSFLLPLLYNAHSAQMHT